MTISNKKINLYSENIIKFILGQKEKIIPLGRIEKIDYVIGVLFLTETNRYFKQNKINSHAYYLAYTFINLFNKIRLKITKSHKFDINDINHFIISLSSNIDYFNSRMESTNGIRLKINNNLAKFQMEIFPTLYTLMNFNNIHDDNINLQNSQNSQGYQPRSAAEQLKDGFGILGVSENSSKEEVKKAYRKQMNQYHPDKLVAKGLPESMMKSATEKTQSIKEAYELINKVKGW